MKSKRQDASQSIESIEVKIDLVKKDIEAHHRTFKEHQSMQKERHDDQKLVLSRIDTDLKEIKDEFKNSNIKLAEYNAQLEIHILGVQQLKEMNMLLREEIQLYRENAEKEFEKIDARLQTAETPIKWFQTTSTWASSGLDILKFILLFAAALGAFEGLSKLLNFL